MSHTAIVEMHKGIVYLFLFSLTIKIGLMLFKPTLFQVVRAKSKIVEMILGPLLLGSGIWAWMARYDFAMQHWILTKLVFMLVGTVLAIIGLKKGNKALAIISLAIFVGVYLLAKYH